MALSGMLRTNRDFRRLWVGSTLSTLGSQISLIAFPLLVLSLGGHATQAGLVATCSLVTRMVFRLPAGQLADRVDLRRLMIGTDVIRLVALGSIPMVAGLGHLGYPQLLAVAAVEGIATAGFNPGSTVVVRDVVSSEQLPQALGMEQTAMGAASLLGPFLGGWLFTVDRILPFTVDAATYGISALLLFRMVIRTSHDENFAEADRGATAGLRWLVRQPTLVRAMVFAGLLNLVGASAEVAVVVTLRAHSSGGTSIGVVMACAGVGAVLGSMVAAKVVGWLKPGYLFLAVGAAWAAGLAVFAASQQPWVVGPVLVLIILLSPPAGIVLGNAMLSQTPRDLLGRVSAATGLLISGLASLGPLLAGVALQGIGIPRTWLLLAGLVAVVTLIAALPMIRNAEIGGESSAAAVPQAETSS
jgi:predicted MFS family arabinose efflux permease